jgi:hypothetical protein
MLSKENQDKLFKQYGVNQPTIMDDLPIKTFKKKSDKIKNNITLRDVKVIRFKNIKKLLDSSSKIYSLKYYDEYKVINVAVRNLNDEESKKRNYSRKYWFIDGESIKNRDPKVIGIPYRNLIAVSLNSVIYIIIKDKDVKNMDNIL